MHRLPVLILCLFVAACVSGCAHDGAPTDTVVREVAELRERTIPSDGHLIRASQPVQDRLIVRADWQIDTGTTDTASYFRWLRSELASEYHVTSETASAVAFTKQTDGDVCTITVSKTGSVTTLAEAHFAAQPD